MEKLNKLEKLATIDELTELYNFRYFKEVFNKEVYRAKRYDRNLSLIVIDINNFKSLNDTQGHATGNGIIKQIARLLVLNTRKSNIVCRYGGDEFVVILPETDNEQTLKLANRLRTVVAYRTSVTISLGVSTFPDNGKTTKGLFNKADRNMYKDKKDKKHENR